MSATRQSGAFDVVTIVGSAGALPAARQILGALPPDFPAAVVYAQHRLATRPMMLLDLVRTSAVMPVAAAATGRPVEPGVIHVTMAGVETVVDADRRFVVRQGRCAGDPLLASVADAYGDRSVGVVLSGQLSDGAAGLRLIKQAGGRGLVQDPTTARAPSMPQAALATGCFDFALTPRRIAEALIALVCVPGAAELLAVRTRPLLETSDV